MAFHNHGVKGANMIHSVHISFYFGDKQRYDTFSVSFAFLASLSWIDDLTAVLLYT